jgi:hypothetical protein
VQALRRISEAADLPRPLVDRAVPDDAPQYPSSVDQIMLSIVIEKLESQRERQQPMPGQLSFDFDG